MEYHKVNSSISGDARDSRLLPDHLIQDKTHSGQGRQNKRPQLLFLAHTFPPVNAVSCVRTWNIAKHLSRLGWEVRVVTPDPALCRFTDSPWIVEESLKREGIQRLTTGYNWRCLLPEHFKCWNSGLGWVLGGLCRSLARNLDVPVEIGWFKACVQTCKSLTEDQVDIILASGPPFISFKLAKYVSEKFKKPYVLDYRDPWSGNPHAPRPFTQSQVQLEAKLLKDCAAVTIVSPSWAEELERRFSVKPKLHVITNGFDPAEFGEVKPTQFNHFTIVYSGSFYPPKRVITPIMAALKQLKGMWSSQLLPEWNFHYFGSQESHVHEEAEKFNVRDRVILHGRVSRSEVLSAVHGAGVAVVITSVSDEATSADKGIIPGKLFEAMGLKTPILFIAPSGSDVEAIAGSRVAYCFKSSDTDGIVAYLMGLMKGLPFEFGNREAYTWPNIAKRLSEILKGAVTQ